MGWGGGVEREIEGDSALELLIQLCISVFLDCGFGITQLGVCVVEREIEGGSVL